MNLRSMDLNLLMVFEAIMSERQVSRAAERLGRSQSAVSHALNRLRVTLNDDLFVRKEYEMVPTQRAQELSKYVSTALADLQGALDLFGEFNAATSVRHFRLGMSDATIFMFLPDLMSRIRPKFGGISLGVRNVGATEGYELLRTGAIDCMILGNVPPAGEAFVSEKILAEKFLCGYAALADLSCPKLSLNDYLARPHVHVSHDGETPGAADIALGAMGLKRNIVATVPNYLVVPAMLNETDLIVTIGEAPLIALASSQNLTLTKPPMELPDVAFYFTTDKRLLNDPAMQWLKSTIRKIADKIREKKDILYDKRPELF